VLSFTYTPTWDSSIMLAETSVSQVPCVCPEPVWVNRVFIRTLIKLKPFLVFAPALDENVRAGPTHHDPTIRTHLVPWFKTIASEAVLCSVRPIVVLSLSW
jgi:hypothetical protein